MASSKVFVFVVMPHCCGRALVGEAAPLKTAWHRMTSDHADCASANQLQSERSSQADRRDTMVPRR